MAGPGAAGGLGGGRGRDRRDPGPREAGNAGMIHMIKLCVGIASVEELESYRDERAHWWDADYGEDVHVHRTRMMPKRRAEMEGVSSIYWVIAGAVACR